MNKQSFGRLFPLGSHLCREPMPPMAELKRDMENLKRHGFSLIKLQEHWGVDEPLEGHYDFGRYEELIGHAAKLDLGIYLGLTCEQAPNWLWSKHPDCRMVGRNGLPIAYQAQSTLPGDGKPGPCYDHPGARADQARFIKQLVATLGRFENVVCWNTWQEVAYWAEGLVGQHVCYCDHTLEHFRRWLSEKYGDLDGLNRAWNTRYLDWCYVIPERNAHGRAIVTQELDWRYFMDNVQVAGVLLSRADAIRAADRMGRTVFCHKAQPTIGAGMDWNYARCQDFMGSSCYPAWFAISPWDDFAVEAGPGNLELERRQALAAEMHNGVCLVYDYVRSCNRAGSPVWAAEFQGGPVSTSLHKGRVPSGEDMRRWMLTAVSCGVSALSFWVTRAEIMAEEMNGFSLLDSVGESTPRYEEAGRIGQALNRHADLFGQPSWGGAPVAIVVDERNYQACNLLGYGSEHLPYDVRGWHWLLWRLGIPVDFAELSHWDEATMGRYKALILPFPLLLSEEAAGKLSDYVAAGGNLISEACPGRLDENAYCNRGELSAAMRVLFGVEQESLTMVREPGNGRRWLPRQRTWGEFLPATMLEGCGPLAGHSLRANLYLETFTCLGSEPCLKHDQAVAGVVRQVGRGRAYLLGTFVGHNGAAYRDQDTLAAVRALLERCDVHPEHEGRLLLRRRAIPGKEAWIFTNTSDSEIEERVSVAGWGSVEGLLDEPLPREGDEVLLSVPPLDIRVLVVRKE